MIHRLSLITVVFTLGCLLTPFAIAADVDDSRPAIKDMTVEQLRAEFHDPDITREFMQHSQRWTDLINALRSHSEELLPRLKHELLRVTPKRKLEQFA